MRRWWLGLLLLTLPVLGQSPCPTGSPDQTAAVQAAIDTQGTVTLGPRVVCLNARTGVRLPSGSHVRLAGAMVGVLPGCSTSCKAFETVPGSNTVHIEGPGEIVGDLAPATGLAIGVRVDSVDGFLMERVAFRDWRYDGFWVGGNLGSHNVVISEVSSRNFGRNGGSVVNGSDIDILGSVFEDSGSPTLLGAGLDIETNPGDSIARVLIARCTFARNVIGLYTHRPSNGGVEVSDVTVVGSTFLDNSSYQAIFNSVQKLEVAGNSFSGGPRGVSIGSLTEAARAFKVNFVGNVVSRTPRALILAGVRDSQFIDNVLSSQKEEPVLGTKGDMVFLRNVVVP